MMKLTDKLYDELMNGTNEDELAKILADALNDAKTSYNEEMARREIQKKKEIETKKLAIADRMNDLMVEYVGLLNPEYAGYASPLKPEDIVKIFDNVMSEKLAEIEPEDEVTCEIDNDECADASCDNEACDTAECSNDVEPCRTSTPAKDEPVSTVSDPVKDANNISYTYDSYIKRSGEKPVREHEELHGEDAANKIRDFWRKHF